MLVTSRHSLHGLFGGRGEQWHNINIHTQQLTKTEALSLCPLNSRISCLSFLQELEQPGSLFVLAAEWYKTVPTPIAFLHKKNTHRSKLWLEKFTAGWGGKVSALATAEQTFNLCIPQLSFEFWGILKDWTASSFLNWKADMNMEEEWG